MTEAEGSLPPSTKRWLQALTWYETFTESGEEALTTAVIRDWQAWNADPENQRVFDHVSRLVADRELYRLNSRRGKAPEATLDDYDPTVSIAEWRKKRSLSAPAKRFWSPSPHWWAWVGGGCTVATILLVVALGSWTPWRWLNDRQGGTGDFFQTAVGELRTIRLNDGSYLTLGGSTRLSVTFSQRNRSVQLSKGEAWFRVAHDPKWPFIVHAGDGVIKAVGTAFLVTRDSDRVMVTVTEGTVAVAATPLVNLSPSFSRGISLLQLSPPIRVTRGEAVSYADNGTMNSVVKADTHAAMAWTQGRLIFDNEPLQYVIESVNRYFPRRISATPSVAALRFSGIIFPAEIEEWLHGLPGIFPLDLDERATGICIHMRAAQANASCTVPP